MAEMHSPGASEEVFLGDVGNPLYELDELLERFDNRLAIDKLALAKRHIDAELRVGLRIIGLRDGARVEYRTVLQRVLPVSEPKKSMRLWMPCRNFSNPSPRPVGTRLAKSGSTAACAAPTGTIALCLLRMSS